MKVDWLAILSGKTTRYIIDSLEKIMANMAELSAKLDAIGAKLDEASAELVAEIQALKDLIAAGGATTPEIDAKVDGLLAKATALADVVPNT